MQYQTLQLLFLYPPPPTLLSSLVCNISQFSYLFGHSINYSRLQSVQNIKEFFSHFAFKNVHFGKSNHVIRRKNCQKLGQLLMTVVAWPQIVNFYYLPQCIIGYIEGTHTHTTVNWEYPTRPALHPLTTLNVRCARYEKPPEKIHFNNIDFLHLFRPRQLGFSSSFFSLSALTSHWLFPPCVCEKGNRN